jgi:hypothetical protein
VSRDFGKLDVSRHLISGMDCASAGLATAEAASPTLVALRNSRRFMPVSPRWPDRPMMTLSAYGDKTPIR